MIEVANINLEHKLRLKFNQYACRKAYKRLETAINENDDHEIYATTGELLLWVLTTEEWHLSHGDDDYKKRRDNSVNGILIKGLRHAYNMVKHNMEFISIHHKEGGLTLPFTLPMTLPVIKVLWMSAGEVLNGRHPNQKENYVKHIEGKEVLKTFSQVMIFLNSESKKYIFKQ